MNELDNISLNCAVLSKHYYQHLRLQQQLSSGLPPLDILRGALDILQWVNLVDLDVQSILLNEIPQLLGILLELLARGNIVVQRSAQELNVLR